MGDRAAEFASAFVLGTSEPAARLEGVWVTKSALPDAGYFVLPKRWSLAALYTLATLIAAGALTAGITHARIGHIEKKVAIFDSDHDDLITLKEAVRSQSKILERIEQKLDRR